MAAAEHSSLLPPIVTFCAAAVVAVPLVRGLGLTSVLGYLAAGIVIGPAGLRLITDQASVVSLAELGVVLLLFVIGLELKLTKLISMRRDIFAAGAGQLTLTAAVLAGVGWAGGIGIAGAAFTGLALAMSSTAVALQMLDERGHLQTGYGQRAFAILLFQDLAIVPILALVPLLGASSGVAAGSGAESARGALIALLALAGVVLAGRYVLNPAFRLLAASGAREVMTAAALLAALGSALVMERAGLSMALGAFLAGVLLAESDFKHQLEADIEPFRGLLLGLFFMGVGMGIDPRFIAANALVLAGLAIGLIGAKIFVAHLVLRVAGATDREALRAATLLAPTGEFAFVILPLVVSAGLLPREQSALVTAAAALTMFIGPVAAKLLELAIARRDAALAPSAEDAAGETPTFDGAAGTVLVIGFGRFGQLVTQVLLAEGVDVTVIDRDVEQVRVAGRFGFKIYYGDGSRLDVLRAAGADKARVIAICADAKDEVTAMVDLIQSEFPLARTFVRAYDRMHAIDLMNRDVDFHVRETMESALAFGQATITELGVDPARAAEIVEDVRKRDVARLVMQRTDGMLGGLDLLRRRKLEPEPLSKPEKRARGLTPETREAMATADP